jgi:hypothetical protein
MAISQLTGFFSFLKRQILPLGLLTVAVIGVLFPQPGRFTTNSFAGQLTGTRDAK